MKGIILAGGMGTRLSPMTRAINKQLIPIYDKPMIYYPLSALMLAGIREILIISTPGARPQFESLFGNGSSLGLNISYAEQIKPNGLAEAFILGADFIADDPCALILGDNIFYGNGLSELLQTAANRTSGVTIFAHSVVNPERYGVVELDDNNSAISLAEKPLEPKSKWAVTGLYFFDNDVIKIAQRVKPSARAELEIIDVIQDYLGRGKVFVEKLGRGYVWLDAGTEDSLLQAAQFVQTMVRRQRLRICCPEEIALHMGLISLSAFKNLAGNLSASDYGQYLQLVAEDYRC